MTKVLLQLHNTREPSNFADRWFPAARSKALW